MSEVVSFGILGCARISRRGLIPGLRESRWGRLAAIASERPGVAREWASEFHIPQAYDTYDALLADANIQAVYIPLANEKHLEWTTKAAKAGKHVLCEKPLARNVAEAEEMVKVLKRHNVTLMEAFMWRHHPRVALALKMLDDGELGELRLVKMDFSFDIDRNDWRLDPARGGGAMFDLGCYGINAARLFARGEPVETRTHVVRHSTGVDMTAAIQLRFANGVAALLDCSFECPYRNRLEIIGTKASIELPEGVLPPPRAKMIVRRHGRSETIEFEPANQYAAQVDAFCQGVALGRLPLPAEDGLANMRALMRAKEACD